MPEAVQESIDLSAEETHVPSLDDDSSYDEVTETTEVSEEPIAGQEAEQEQQTESKGKYGFGNPDLDARIDSWAKRAKHLDPGNPEHLKTLRSLAEKDLMIERFKSIQDKFDPGNPEHAALAKELFGNKEDGTDGDQATEPALTEFEKSMAEPGVTEKEEVKADKKEATTAAATPAADEDPGAKWKTVADAYDDLTAAWSEIQDSMAKAAAEGKRYVPDYTKVNRVETALLDRRLEAMVAPVMEEFATRLNKISERLGGVLPDLENSVSRQRLADTKTFAVAELSKTGQYQDIDKMFTAIDGPPITINGEKFANSPFHKAVAQAPWIMDIHAKGKDQKSTDALTMIARLRAAHQVLNGASKSKEQVKRALEAGQKLTERNRDERVRQNLNSGNGTNSLESDSKKGGYMSEIMGSDEMSVLEL